MSKKDVKDMLGGALEAATKAVAPAVEKAAEVKKVVEKAEKEVDKVAKLKSDLVKYLHNKYRNSNNAAERTSLKSWLDFLRQ